MRPFADAQGDKKRKGSGRQIRGLRATEGGGPSLRSGRQKKERTTEKKRGGQKKERTTEGDQDARCACKKFGRALYIKHIQKHVFKQKGLGHSLQTLRTALKGK